MNALLSAQRAVGVTASNDHAVLPSLDHLDLTDFDQYVHAYKLRFFTSYLFLSSVYEPADDTFLLCDALQQQRLELLELRPFYCLEIGCVRLLLFE